MAGPRTKAPNILQLYYITHIDNIPSILKHGVLSHQEVETRHLTYIPIYDKSIVSSRRNKKTPDDKSLWDYANLYFKARNAMLYRVALEKPIDQIVVIAVDFASIVGQPGVFISTGNAASNDSDFIPTTPRKKIGEAFAKFQGALGLDYWSDFDGTKRMMMAECLIPEKVPPDRITGIYTPGRQTANKVSSVLTQVGRTNLPVIPDPGMFSQPSFQKPITSNLLLTDGKILYSRLQTHTVSVNTESVMGIAVASRSESET